VQSFTLEEPHITLRRSPAGDWNFSTIGTRSTTPPASNQDTAGGGSPNVAIAKLAISNGQVTIVAPGARGKERVYTGVNLEASNLSYRTQFPFRLDAKTPGGGALHMEGKAGPLDANDASATPVEARVELKQFDVASSGFVDPSSGLAGVIDFTGTLTSNGREAVSKGTVSAAKLQLVQGSSASRVPMTVDYQSTYDLKRRTGTIDQGEVHIGRALARLSGSYSAADTTSVRMKVTGHQMPVPELEAALPAVGVTLPAGATLDTGALDLDLDVNGPIDRLTTTGPIRMSNARLKGFDLGSQMAAIAAFAGMQRSTDTTIETLSAAVKVAPDGIRADAIQLVVPAIGKLTGSGTIAPQGALDFKMVAQLAATSGVAGSVARITSLGRPEAGTPFLITGTTSSPRFVPDVAGAVRGLMKPENATKTATGLLRGLLDKKRK
jgi:AsmA protein